MKAIIEQNAQAKALVRRSRGKSTKEMREITELSIKDAFASIQKHLPEMGETLPTSSFTETPPRQPAINGAIPALPAEIWTKIAKQMKAVDGAASKTLRLVNRQLKDIAEHNVKTVIIKNNDAFQLLKKTGSYKNAEKFILIGNEGEFRKVPSTLEGKLHYVERRRRDDLDVLGRKRPELAWNHFDRIKKETEGTTFSLIDAAKAAGVKMSNPPARSMLSAWFRDLLADPKREKMEHFLKQGFTAEEAAEITNVHSENLISELGARRLAFYPAQRDRARARELSMVKEVVDELNVMAAMQWLNEQEQRAEQGQQRL